MVKLLFQLFFAIIGAGLCQTFVMPFSGIGIVVCVVLTMPFTVTAGLLYDRLFGREIDRSEEKTS